MFLLFGFGDRRNGERPLGKGDDDICASTDGDAAGTDVLAPPSAP